MNIFDRFRKAPKPVKFHEEVETGAFGGTLSRVSPTVIGQIFDIPPLPFRPGGIQVNTAARPPRAPMLDNAFYHSQIITGRGIVKQTFAVGFKRENEGNVHGAAVDNAVHVTNPNAHPSTIRKALRGQSG